MTEKIGENIKVNKIEFKIDENGDSVMCNFYPSGKIKTTSVIKDGERHGKEKCYYENGQLNYESYVINGEPWEHGKFYSEKGDSLFAGTLIFGNGSYYSYYPNGKILVEAFYKNSMRDSIWTFYSSEGEIYKKEIYKNGKLLNN